MLTQNSDSQEPHTNESQHSLYLQRIVVENFKSYFGRHAVGDFHPDFTSIVGSNGSGKSNIIDALLFVFGFRSNYLRHQKLSNLIYSGHTQCQFCIVELHFIKEHQESYIISRKVDINNNSTYYVNNKTTPFKDVKELVMSWGIDLEHNRFMILQGEIESISQMKPIGASNVAGIPTPDKKSHGLLEYLEDIIGTTEFHLPLFETFNKVQELDEETETCSRQVNLAQKDRDALLQPYEEAMSYINKHNEMTELQNMVYQQNKLFCLEQIENLQSAMDKFTNQTNELNAKLADIDNQQQSTNKEMQSYMKNHKSNESQVTTIKSKINKLEKTAVQLENEIKHAKSTMQKKLKLLTTNDDKLKQLVYVDDSTIAALELEIENIKSNFESASKQLNKMRLVLKKQLLPIEQECQAVQSELTPLTNEITSIKNQMQLITKESDALKSKKLLLQNTNKQEMMLLKQEELDYIIPIIAENDLKLNKLQKTLNDLNEQSNAYKSEIESISGILEQQQSELSLNSSKDKTTQFLLNLKQRQLPGIHGKLGDLGTIDNKYDVAISTAAPSLHNFVVQSINDANTCVSELRKNKLNRCTFMVLDKIKQNAISRSIDTPENVPRLFDLIQCDDSLKCAFYYAVRDTIVATDIEQARRISNSMNRRWRVVTLTGDLIEPSGVMSGGGNRKFSGAMRNLSAGGNTATQPTTDKHEISKLNAKLATVQSKLKELTISIKSKESEMEQLRGSSMDYAQVSKELESELQNLELLETWTQDQDLINLENQQKSLYTQLQQLQVQTEPLDIKLTECKARLKATGGKELELLQVRVNDLNNDLKDMTGRLKNSNKCKLVYKQEFGRLEKESLKLDKELQNAQNLILTNENEFKVVDKSIRQTRQELVLHEQTFDKENAEMQVFKEELNKLENASNAIKQQLMGITNSLDDIKREGRLQEKEMNKIELEMKKLHLYPTDEEEQQLKSYTGDDLDGIDAKTITKEINKLKTQLGKLKPNLTAVNAYKSKTEMLNSKLDLLNEAKLKQDTARQCFDILRLERTSKFMNGFNIISKKLKEIYCFLTMGGNAELEFVDSLDPFSEGIQFSVMPPKKSWKLISNLSGGEKTLSSLALVYALHHFKPCPIYVMDEIGSLY